MARRKPDPEPEPRLTVNNINIEAPKAQGVKSAPAHKAILTSIEAVSVDLRGLTVDDVERFAQVARDHLPLGGLAAVVIRTEEANDGWGYYDKQDLVATRSTDKEIDL